MEERIRARRGWRRPDEGQRDERDGHGGDLPDREAMALLDGKLAAPLNAAIGANLRDGEREG